MKITGLQSETFSDISVLIQSRCPLIYLTSHEEERVMKNLALLATNVNKKFYSWSVTNGLVELNIEEGDISDLNSFNDPMEILGHIESSKENAIYVLKDFHFYMEDFTVIRKLRDLFGSLKVSYKNIIFLSPHLKLPIDLNKEISVVDIPLPTSKEFLEMISEIKSNLQASMIDIEEKDINLLAKAAHGLTLAEAENVFSKMIVCEKKLSKKGLPYILNEKRQIVRKSGILEFYPASNRINDLGGFSQLKKWLEERGQALFSSKAKKYGLPEPKGILLLGPPGTGKSLTAKVVSNYWQLPLLKLDFGKIFSGLVGSSEENMREALKTAEGLSPSILWVDEIEKGLSGGTSSGSDGGTAARVFGSFLTWMQEKKSTVFVIATANDISKLPPELLRKGRFDEIFFLDLPKEKEKEEIFSIHLAKKGRDPKNFNIKDFSIAAKDFTGAEIEQTITDALFQAFNQQKEINNEEILSAIKACIPLSTTYSHELGALREWARLRAKKAS
ncbi:MAG: AAA family ATPase [Bacteriovorax sp.]